MSILAGIIIIIIALFSEAFFSGSETGIISTNKIKLSYLADKGDRRARIIKALMDNRERFLGTTLVGVNLSVIISSSVASILVGQSLEPGDYTPLITTLIMLPLILIFGEIIPKAIFRRYADTISLWAAYPLRIASTILFPIVWLATKISNLVSTAFIKRKTKKIPYVTREELRLLLGESAKQDLLTKDEVRMAYEIFDFGRTEIRSVMVPIISAISASDVSSREELSELIAQSGYSRIPIYKDSPENIIGTIQVSDLIKDDIKNNDIKGLIRSAYTVQEDRPIDEILEELKVNQKNIAIVTNKQNQTVGIATLEDIVEEIVGEIGDEYDTGPQSSE